MELLLQHEQQQRYRENQLRRLSQRLNRLSERDQQAEMLNNQQ